jgi:hypothetical protein
MSEYLAALLKGRELPSADRQRIAKTLQEWTGISVDYYLNHDLVITKVEFAKQLLRDRRQILGAYDARYAGPAPPAGERAVDPFAKAVAATMPLFTSYLHDTLGIADTKEYRGNAPDVGGWNYDSTGGAGGPFLDYDYQAALDKAFAANPRFRLMIGTGI